MPLPTYCPRGADCRSRLDRLDSNFAVGRYNTSVTVLLGCGGDYVLLILRIPSDDCSRFLN